MTKKHFVALADAMRESRSAIDSSTRGLEFKHGRLEQWTRDVAQLAEFCAEQNPRFNRQRWLGYINGENGPNGGKLK